MQSQLITAVSDIRSNRALISTDEASTKAGVVLRLLSTLGWDPFNIEEIRPEYTVGGKRVDYALRISNASKVFIEVKRIGEELEKHQEQLLNYSFKEGVKLAVLTNGATWWFYLPLNEGSWEQRRFYAIEMFEQDPKDIAERFIELLAKENVKSGDALSNAERLYKSRQKIQKLKEAIPKAWTKIISEPDDLLVDLLIETTEKISGFRPDAEDIEKFLRDNYQQQYPTPSCTPARKGSATKHKRTLRAARKDPGNYTHTKLLQFSFLGKEYTPRYWWELLVTVAAVLHNSHRSEFIRLLSPKGNKRAYFSKNSDELQAPKQIAGSKYYAETCLNANTMVKKTRELVALFGYNESDLEIVAE